MSLALIACQSEQEETAKPEGLAPVDFFPTAESGLTRADRSYVDDEDLFPQNAVIGLFGYDTGAAVFQVAGSEANFFYNQPVTYVWDRSGGDVKKTWEYAPLKYWPNTEGTYLSFMGYHPYNGAGITPQLLTASNGSTYGAAYNNSTEGRYGRPRYLFVAQHNSKYEVDFMVTHFLYDSSAGVSEMPIPHGNIDQLKTNYGITGRVPLRFRHVLAQVEIVVKMVEGSDAILQKVENLRLTNLYDQATCSYAEEAPHEPAWTDLDYTVPGAPVDFTRPDLTYEYDGVGNMLDISKDTRREGLFLLLPQDFSTKDAATIEFDYYMEGDTEPTHATVQLNLCTYGETPTPLTKWLQGKSYLYTISLNSDGEKIDEVHVGIRDWTDKGTVEHPLYNW